MRPEPQLLETVQSGELLTHPALCYYEGTPTDYCKDQAVFDAGAVPSQFEL